MSGQYKIIFSGPVGAGKTTAIAAISDIPPITTEQRATDDVRMKKDSTTVAMDYGSIRLKEGDVINLYGTPGQERFDFMWDILAEGAIGLILMLDHLEKDPVGDMNRFLDSFLQYFDANQIIVAVNKYHPRHPVLLKQYIQALKKRELSIPVLEIDAREKKDVVIVVQSLLLNLDPGLESVAS